MSTSMLREPMYADGAAAVEKEPMDLVLIVDDLEVNRALLTDQLSLLGYRTAHAENGRDALDKIARETPAVILLDLSMPIMDGETFLRHAAADDELRKIPIVVISSLDDMETVGRCIESGAEDYLVKPFKPRILRARMTNALAKSTIQKQEIALRQMAERYNEELKAQVKAQVKQISQAQLGTIFALSTLAESRDPETGEHLERMRLYCRVLAQTLSKDAAFAPVVDESFVNTIFEASPLHDIGKVGIPDEVLLKPGKLSDEEFAIMKQHSEIGASTLERVHAEFPENEFIRMGIEIAAAHHERWDGSGYPNKLAGDAIPIAARILAVCDVYDALTSKRCYKAAFSHEKSRAIIVEGRGTHFQPEMVDAFLLSEADFVEIQERFHEAS